MKILTAEQMREVDRRTIELGIPGIILMENAGHRVVEFLEETFAPLEEHRIVVVCGKGNNGGDGMVIARQLHTRIHPRSLNVVLAGDPSDFKGDALINFRMLQACGCAVTREFSDEMRTASLVIDALLGTGLRGPVTGHMREVIRGINERFPLAKIVSVDIPSGLASDFTANPEESDCVRADYTVTFTALKVGQVLPPNCTRVGHLRVAPIGSPPELYENDDAAFLALSDPADFRWMFGPRPPDSHKGTFGHVLVVAGSRGKTGAAAMSGMAALRGGAGLVTVASAESATPVIAAHTPELMTEPLPETGVGAISSRAFERVAALAENKDVIALGPGLGTDPETVELVRRLFAEIAKPMVIDADGLNALAGTDFKGAGGVRILTPHPGEMRRLVDDRFKGPALDGSVGETRWMACQHQVTVVRKGFRTLIGSADGRVWVNPTGSPAMATGGTGDILTGLIAALLAQHLPKNHSGPGYQHAPDVLSAGSLCARAAVFLHGLAGEIGAEELGEQALIATDLLSYVPDAMTKIRQ